MEKEKLARAIKRVVLEAGYVACGICAADPFPELERSLRQRAAEYPVSAALYDELHRFVDPRSGRPWARSIVVGLRHYGRFRLPASLERRFGRYYLVETGLPYAEHPAVHARVVETMADLGVRAETVELAARQAAVRAGLGRISRNNFLQTAWGSWVFIDTWLCDAEPACDQMQEGDPCPPGCRRCLAACSTGAITGAWAMDWGRCATQRQTADDPLPGPDGSRGLGGWLYGCDACQSCCPLNRGRWQAEADFPGLAEFAARFSPEAVLAGEPALYRDLNAKFGFIGPEEGWKWRRAVHLARQET